MIHHRLPVVGWFVLLLLGVGAAASDATEPVRVGRVLAAGQIDSSTVDVGAFVMVVYGQGKRHPVSGAWTRLDTARGYIKAVNLRRLIIGLEPDGWSKWIALDRIQTLSLIGTPFSGLADRDRIGPSTTKLVQPAQAEPEAARSDSLSEKMEMMTKRYYEKASNQDALRIAKKVAAGTGLSVFLGIIASNGLASADDNSNDSSNRNDLAGAGYLFFGSAIGIIVGFPLGVTTVDPYDSWPKTLLGGVIPVLTGFSLLIASDAMESQETENIGVMVMYLGPIIGSLYASEKSRQPLSAELKLKSQDRRVSFGLAPTLNGGLSAVAQLRF